MRVELRCAPLPYIGALAVHYWFVLIDESGAHRWEVWQTKGAGGRDLGPDAGHVHCDLKSPEAGVGGGPSRIETEWRGEEALAIAAVLREPLRYPECRRYRVWPGPNSNSFVAWVLDRAGIAYRLGWRGIGRGWWNSLTRNEKPRF